MILSVEPRHGVDFVEFDDMFVPFDDFSGESSKSLVCREITNCIGVACDCGHGSSGSGKHLASNLGRAGSKPW